MCGARDVRNHGDYIFKPGAAYSLNGPHFQLSINIWGASGSAGLLPLGGAALSAASPPNEPGPAREAYAAEADPKVSCLDADAPSTADASARLTGAAVALVEYDIEVGLLTPYPMTKAW